MGHAHLPQPHCSGRHAQHARAGRPGRCHNDQPSAAAARWTTQAYSVCSCRQVLCAADTKAAVCRALLDLCSWCRALLQHIRARLHRSFSLPAGACAEVAGTTLAGVEFQSLAIKPLPSSEIRFSCSHAGSAYTHKSIVPTIPFMRCACGTGSGFAALVSGGSPSMPDLPVANHASSRWWYDSQITRQHACSSRLGLARLLAHLNSWPELPGAARASLQVMPDLAAEQPIQLFCKQLHAYVICTLQAALS